MLYTYFQYGVKLPKNIQHQIDLAHYNIAHLILKLLPSIAIAAVRPEEEMITLGLSRSGSSGENNGTAAVSNSKSSTFPATPGGVGRSQHVGQPQQAQQQRSGGGQHKPIRRTPGPPMSGMQNVGRQARHRRTPGAHSHDVS